jgi:hypothetical protein
MNAIYEQVTDTPKRAGDIAKALGMTKSEVNKWLYANDKTLVRRVDDQNPPRWVRYTDTPKSNSNVWIFVDLRNVHDVLQNIEIELENGLEANVCAVADLQFNGYGVNPSPSNTEITVWKSTDPHKNSANIRLVWEICKLAQAGGGEFHVVTKDNGFRSLATLVEASGSSIEFHSDWDCPICHV